VIRTLIADGTDELEGRKKSVQWSSHCRTSKSSGRIRRTSSRVHPSEERVEDEADDIVGDTVKASNRRKGVLRTTWVKIKK
jgi:hypothetical protein